MPAWMIFMCSLAWDMDVQRRMATPPEGRIHDAFDWSGGAADFAFFYWVNDNGRIDECQLVMPSGREAFDSGLCNSLIERGRFEPARDEDGNPLRVARFENMRVRISHSVSSR